MNLEGHQLDLRYEPLRMRKPEAERTAFLAGAAPRYHRPVFRNTIGPKV